ncbi:hypothetical protein PCK1_002006 [Pneumocystis canis]|nr:hypothetical protein PCK1_002006 [Pneumocystis canis]
MHQLPLIYIPKKKTVDLDWIQPLKQFIQATSIDGNQYTNECNILNKLRQDIQETNMDLTSKDILYKYYGQLEFLDLRFPIDEKNIQILFKWYCAFTNKPISQYSLAYEKACVMFNIAATLSAIGATQDRSEKDGAKKAYHSFQSSAGILEYINSSFLHAPSIDLQKDTLQSLYEIMLAQAQEVLCEKQINKSEKPNMISKLSAQTAWCYENIVSRISTNVQKKIFKKYWLQLCEIKQRYYKSIAHLNKALVNEKNDIYGEALAHLNLAKMQCYEASRLSSSLLLTIPASDKPKFDSMSYFNNAIKNLYTQIQEKENKLNNDNDYIYHQSVINEKCLKPLEKLSLAKATPIQEIYINQNVQKLIGQDIFHKFIPLSDGILQNLNTMSELPGVSNNLSFLQTIELEKYYFKSQRCLVISESYFLCLDYKSALALAIRGYDYLSKISITNNKELITVNKTELIKSKNNINIKMNQFRAFLCLSIQEINEKDIFLKEIMNNYPQKLDLSRLVDLPSKLELLSYKPIFFDIAYNYIDYKISTKQPTTDKNIFLKIF